MKTDNLAPITITLCALTYHRPVGVTKMLEGVGQLVFKGDDPSLRIVIVDNDPDGSSRDVVADAARSIRWPVKYVVESQRGITYARNRALREAGGSEWIGFIDDDEIPDATWLDELFRVQCDSGADVVSGPVIPELPAHAPNWIGAGGFFNQMRYTTGTTLPYCFTNNVIFRSRVIQEVDMKFDHQYALTGGEDRDFFQRIANRGFRIVWADKARVYETVPLSRANAKWILKRSYRCGNTIVATDLVNQNQSGVRGRLFMRACWSVLGGGVFFLLSGLRGQKYSVRHLQDIFWGIGMFTGLLGSRYVEYQTTHGQ